MCSSWETVHHNSQPNWRRPSVNRKKSDGYNLRVRAHSSLLWKQLLFVCIELWWDGDTITARIRVQLKPLYWRSYPYRANKRCCRRHFSRAVNRENGEAYNSIASIDADAYITHHNHLTKCTLCEAARLCQNSIFLIGGNDVVATDSQTEFEGNSLLGEQ